jgi:hypothetical protein
MMTPIWHVKPCSLVEEGISKAIAQMTEAASTFETLVNVFRLHGATFIFIFVAVRPWKRPSQLLAALF